MLTKSSTELIRRQNRALVLGALRRKNGQSHTELAVETGLASATVTSITHELVDERIIERTEAPPAGGRGRPRILFRQRRSAAYAAFVRISSDMLQYSMVDYSGTLIHRIEEKRDNAGQKIEDFAAGIRAALFRLASKSRVSREDLKAISISSKGVVADDNTTLLWSSVLGSQQIDMRKTLAQDWDAHVTLSHESLLVASALHSSLSQTEGRPIPRLAALSLGHSIGLGVVHADGYESPRARAPGFGHMIHSHGGALCRCGSYGCIEAYAGSYAILRAAFKVPLNTIPANFVPFMEIAKIAGAARKGDRLSSAAFRDAGTAIGNGLARLISLHGKMPVVFTGPGVPFFDLMRPGIDEGLSASLGVRIEGPPEISLSLDEERLVFEGHLNHTMAAIDREAIAPRTAGGRIEKPGTDGRGGEQT
ncbi:ROK family transcriptional regulator [Hoeflea sp.]|uniref:ROK family transcriptional regulator n=1 Tax=Hoeflea sp. TaxID=1940281 RepID=UPI003B52FEB4